MQKYEKLEKIGEGKYKISNMMIRIRLKNINYLSMKVHTGLFLKVKIYKLKRLSP